MTFLPIVERELRVSARRPRTYVSRVFTGLIGAVVFCYMLGMTRVWGVNHQVGRMMFSMLSGIGFFLCLTSGLGTTDCISEEKREGTLGLLFLTDLKGYDIILGKLCANGLASLYNLMAFVPIVAMSLFFGGVTGTQIIRMALVLLNVLLFSHAAAMVGSAFETQAGRARGFASSIVMVCSFILPALVAWMDYKHQLVLSSMLRTINPCWTYFAVSYAGTRNDPFWRSLGVSNLLSWGLLALASWRVRDSWRDQAGARVLRWRERMRQWTYGSPRAREALRKQLLDINPFLWVASRFRFSRALVWFGLGITFFIYVFGWRVACHFNRGMTFDYFALPIILTLHLIVKLWVETEATRHIEEQRLNGGLALVMGATPLGTEDILKGQWLALRRLFLWPVAAVLVADVPLVYLFQRIQSGSDQSLAIGCSVAGMIVFVADIVALGWVGMWMGICSKKLRSAAGATATRILFLPWILFGLWAWFASWLGQPEGWLNLAVWTLISLAVDILFIRHARFQLSRKFREYALTPPYEQIGMMGDIGKVLGRLFK